MITPRELLREEELTDIFNRGDRASHTRVRTAVSWLERSEFLRCDQNLTQVFQGKPLVCSMEAAEEKIRKPGPPKITRNLWGGILTAMFNARALQYFGKFRLQAC